MSDSNVIFNVCDIQSDASVIKIDAIHSLFLCLLTSEPPDDSSKCFFRAVYSQHINHYRLAKHELNTV